jgi:hypothetical protein
MNTHILAESSIPINFRVPTNNPMTTLAEQTGSITATIWQIPNQPFRFWACYSVT